MITVNNVSQLSQRASSIILSDNNQFFYTNNPSIHQAVECTPFLLISCGAHRTKRISTDEILFSQSIRLQSGELKHKKSFSNPTSALPLKTKQMRNADEQGMQGASRYTKFTQSTP